METRVVDRSAPELPGTSRAVRGAAWVGLYLLVAVAPLVFASIEPPPGRGFSFDVSVALGFVGLSMLGLQFALTARIRATARPFGIDAVLQFHRLTALVAFAFVLAHPALIFATAPAWRGVFDPLAAPTGTRLGMAALLFLAVLVVMSLWRLRLRLSYEAWRLTHGILAVAVVGAALLHVEAAGFYVDTPWKRALWAAMSTALVGLLLWVRIVKPIRMIRRPYEVVDVSPEGEGTYTIALRPVGHDGLRFRPGQFAWLTVRDSPFSIEEHPFSFSSSSARPERLELTVKELGDFTETVKDIQPGTRAYLDGPYGVFTPDRHKGAGYVFVAGGVGITPVMSMLRTFEDRDERRPLTLVYANTDEASIAFRDELDRLSLTLELDVVHVLEEPPEGWDGETGYVTEEVLERVLPERNLPRLQYFVCGPPPMMDLVERSLLAHDVPPERIQSERFDFI